SGGTVGLRVMPVEGGVRLDVWDTGPGIPEEHFAQVWEAFSQLEIGDATRRGGLGLGLTIVKMLVALHGGRVGLVSQLGKGSTFTVELPLDAPLAPLTGVGGVEKGSEATIPVRTQAWNAASPQLNTPNPRQGG
ncbi:MAG: sensor histidine kinase, partial [Candidatus Sericytochromatia bacterium]